MAIASFKTLTRLSAQARGKADNSLPSITAAPMAIAYNDGLNELAPDLPLTCPAVAPMMLSGRAMPEVVYSQAQRWGSAVPAPRGWEGEPMESMGVAYQAAIPPLLPTVPAAAAAAASPNNEDLVTADD